MKLFRTIGVIEHLAHLGYAVFFFLSDHLDTARLYTDRYGLSRGNVSLYRVIVEEQTGVVVWSNIDVTVFWIVNAALA